MHDRHPTLSLSRYGSTPGSVPRNRATSLCLRSAWPGNNKWEEQRRYSIQIIIGSADRIILHLCHDTCSIWVSCDGHPSLWIFPLQIKNWPDGQGADNVLFRQNPGLNFQNDGRGNRFGGVASVPQPRGHDHIRTKEFNRWIFVRCMTAC
jgi:hypothetical protein